MTARAVGWDIMRKKLASTKASSLVNDPHEDVRQILKTETQLSSRSRRGLLREKTRWNLQKLLKYRNPDAVEGIAEKAKDHMVCDYRPLVLPHRTPTVSLGPTFGYSSRLQGPSRRS